ncbi:uncharacterized protein LOC130140068 [Syzygium oleosum]|uniref:uncharacterized protein LOC130140068 n=1 Tax=Syzygium oleosum TaxID=219896 RepID=UPI0024B90035|nr:uncharacterized protein LOC130140068 [Syzygium oleosum]
MTVERNWSGPLTPPPYEHIESGHLIGGASKGTKGRHRRLHSSGPMAFGGSWGVGPAGESRCRSTNILEDDDIDLEEQLKLLNKSPVETLLTDEGDTIDCVDIDKQPALDHPLLKNHKVQRKPNLLLGPFPNIPLVQSMCNFRSRKPCPIGTVPFQRIQKEDLIRTRSLPKMPYANMVKDGYAPFGQHGDGWRDGCYNTLCLGFVQVDRIITPNYPMITVSKYGGPIYELKVEVSQDVSTGNWWLRVHDPPINVGYWPKELFVNLQKGTFTTGWGGIAKESENGYCPPMGNGLLPDADYRKAAYFRKAQWMNAKGESFPPYEGMPMVVDGGYGLLDMNLREEPWGYYFSFGGPGGYCRA